jgi:hypothetical protein
MVSWEKVTKTFIVFTQKGEQEQLKRTCMLTCLSLRFSSCRYWQISPSIEGECSLKRSLKKINILHLNQQFHWRISDPTIRLPIEQFIRNSSRNIRSRIHERTISLSLLGIILRVLRLEVPPFSLQFTVTNCRNCKKLREFEEEKSQGKAVEMTVNSKEENSQNFCLDFV